MEKISRHLNPKIFLLIGAGAIGLLAQQLYAALTEATVYVADLSPEWRTVAQRLGAHLRFHQREIDAVVATITR